MVRIRRPGAEPALGPVTFMHRESASENPAAPLSHHEQDSTHTSFGVVTTGFVADRSNSKVPPLTDMNRMKNAGASSSRRSIPGQGAPALPRAATGWRNIATGAWRSPRRSNRAISSGRPLPSNTIDRYPEAS